jgi:hypothetical protein
MNYGAAVGQEAKMPDKTPDPMGPSIVKTMEYNVERMHKNINRIEDQLHNILNQRHPGIEGKDGTPIENDLNSVIAARLNAWAILNDRLDAIVAHLDRIVG